MKNDDDKSKDGGAKKDQMSPRMLLKKAAEKAAFNAWVKGDMKESNGAPQHGREEIGPQLDSMSEGTPTAFKDAQSPELPQHVAQESAQWPVEETETDKISDVPPKQSASEIHTEDSATAHARETSNIPIDREPKSSARVFALVGNANEISNDESARATIVVSQKKTEACKLQQDQAKVRVRADLKKLMHQKLRGIADQIKIICEKALTLPKVQVSVGHLLEIGAQSERARLGCEVTFPAVHLQYGKAEEFQKCIQLFAELLCKQEPWTEDYIKKQSEKSIEYIAAMAAKDLRKKWGEHQLPDEARINSPSFNCEIKLGGQVGPAPEPSQRTEVEDITGAFRSLHPDLLHCHFAEDSLVQGQNLVFQVKNEQLVTIHRLATPRLQTCTVKVNKILEDDEVVQIDLIEIVSVQGECF